MSQIWVHPRRRPGHPALRPVQRPRGWVSPRALRVLYGAVPVFLQMTEMEISRAAAERSLREHMGNVVEALITLTN